MFLHLVGSMGLNGLLCCLKSYKRSGGASTQDLDSAEALHECEMSSMQMWAGSNGAAVGAKGHAKPPH